MPLFQYSLLTYIFLGYHAYVNVLPLPPCEAGLTHISYLFCRYAFADPYIVGLLVFLKLDELNMGKIFI